MILDDIKRLHAFVVKYGYVQRTNSWAKEIYFLDWMRAVVSRDGFHTLNGPGFTVSFNDTLFIQQGPTHEHLADIEDWIRWRLGRFQPERQ